MSIKVMSLVWENFNRGGSEKLAMLALADWCNDQGGSLHPSINSIAKKINVSESQARRIVHGFINEGYLTVIANHNGGDKGQTRHYRLNIELLVTPSASATRTPSVDATPCTDATPSMDAHDPLAPMRVTPSTHDTLTTIEPSIEPSINIPSKKSNPKPKSKELNFQEYLDHCIAENVEPIPMEDQIFNYAEKIGLPLDFLEIAWKTFKENMLSNPDKKQKNWKQTFGVYVRNNYMKLWFFKDGLPQLTTVGIQQQNFHRD
jgi:hypothetical protein